jgi:hypothetical protein
MEKILAARAQGTDLGDHADVLADLHARGLPDAVCMATLDALIATAGTCGRRRGPVPGAATRPNITSTGGDSDPG